MIRTGVLHVGGMSGYPLSHDFCSERSRDALPGSVGTPVWTGSLSDVTRPGINPCPYQPAISPHVYVVNRANMWRFLFICFIVFYLIFLNLKITVTQLNVLYNLTTDLTAHVSPLSVSWLLHTTFWMLQATTTSLQGKSSLDSVESAIVHCLLPRMWHKNSKTTSACYIVPLLVANMGL